MNTNTWIRRSLVFLRILWLDVWYWNIGIFVELFLDLEFNLIHLYLCKIWPAFRISNFYWDLRYLSCLFPCLKWALWVISDAKLMQNWCKTHNIEGTWGAGSVKYTSVTDVSTTPCRIRWSRNHCQSVAKPILYLNFWHFQKKQNEKY